MNKNSTILGIETSCDETSAAIVKDGREIRSNIVYTQIALHKPFGGVVPEIASRNHVEHLTQVVGDACLAANCSPNEVDAIAVTCGPGLVGALITGVSYAKGLALATGKPLIGVHHIQGHICANYLAHPQLEPPFLCLVVSGGHSHIIAVKSYTTYELLGATRDDAAGEAFDKAARALGLPYPGGPEMERLAQNGNPNAYTFPKGFNSQSHYDFSFSGLKTALINSIHNFNQKNISFERADVAASFQKAVVDILVSKTLRAAKENKFDKLVLAGGVAANLALREGLTQSCANEGISFFCPPTVLCTDNAAMIASAGYYGLLSGQRADLSLNASASLPIFKRTLS